MKRSILTILLLAAVAAIQAQGSDEARSLLDKTAAKLSGEGGVSASFSASGRNGEASGTIIIKGNKFHVQTEQAAVWFDETTQWVYSKATDEVNISESTDDQQTINLYKLITLYKSGYSLTSSSSGSSTTIHATAQSDSKRLKELYITVNSQNDPTQIKLRTSNGWSTVNITNVKSGNFADSTFRFNPKDYPTAEVIDLR